MFKMLNAVSMVTFQCHLETDRRPLYDILPFFLNVKACRILLVWRFRHTGSQFDAEASWYGNGNLHGPIIREHFYGETGTGVPVCPGEGASRMVEIYQRYFCRVDSEPALQIFVDKLNHFHGMIKFTANWSTEEVVFLDTRVYLRNGLVKTDLHTIPTDTHQYLRKDSYHPMQALKTAKLFANEEFARIRITSVNDVTNLRHICLTEVINRTCYRKKYNGR